MDSKLQQEREENGGTPFAEARGSAAGVESEEPCQQCDGKGWYAVQNCSSLPWEAEQRQCEACYGTGRVEKAKPQPNVQALRPARGNEKDTNEM